MDDIFIRVTTKKGIQKHLINIKNIGFIAENRDPLGIIINTEDKTILWLNFGNDRGIALDQTLDEVEELIKQAKIDYIQLQLNLTPIVLAEGKSALKEPPKDGALDLM